MVGDVGPFLFYTFLAFALSVLTAYSVYRFYNKHKISDDRINQVIMFILVSFALISILMFLYLILTPWSTFEGPSRDFEKTRDTSIGMSPVYEQNDEMHIQVSNKGDRAINVSKYEILYGPPDWSPVSYKVIESRGSKWSVGGDGNQCFTSNMSNGSEMDSDILSVGEMVNCSTGIKFPDKNETVQIKVEAKNFVYSTSYECSVESKDAGTC